MKILLDALRTKRVTTLSKIYVRLRSKNLYMAPPSKTATGSLKRPASMYGAAWTADVGKYSNLIGSLPESPGDLVPKSGTPQTHIIAGKGRAAGRSW